MDQTLEFHPAKADLAKHRGMSLAADNCTLLEKAREAAVCMAERYQRPVTVDDVYGYMEYFGHHPERLGNAWGSVFKGWKPIGFVKSKRVSNHSRIIREWVRR